MILSSKYVVNMEKKYQKILYLYHAVNNTFVIMTMPGRATDNIVHMDANGKILFEFTFPKYIDSFGMINDYEAIVCETRLNRVTILNLLTHQFRYITHYFKYEESDQVNIMTFADTKLYCVQENGRYNENHFKLTYYHDGDEQPYHIWAPESDEWTY